MENQNEMLKRLNHMVYFPAFKKKKNVALSFAVVWFLYYIFWLDIAAAPYEHIPITLQMDWD